MRQLQENPVVRTVLLCICYVASCAVVMAANAKLAGDLELPWTWYWFLWTALFAPTVLATAFASVWTAPAWARLRVLYGVSLLAILVVMETLWLIASAGHALIFTYDVAA